TNFIVNEQFEGFEANLQGGLTELGDAENLRASFGAGTTIGTKGHLVLGVEGYRSAGVPNIYGRDWWKAWCNLDMGVNATPRRVLVENCQNRTQTYGGFISSGPLVGTMFLEDGSPAMFQNGSILDAAAVTGL